MTELPNNLEQNVKEIERLMQRLAWVQHKRMARDLNALGLTVPQFFALLTIYRQAERVPIGKLADDTGQCSATMTGIVDRLVKAGLVERQRNPQDRRSVLVTLTEQGRHLLETALERRQRHALRALGCLTPQEQIQFLRLLRTVLEALLENMDTN